jgi:hypothetical protein
LAAIEQSYNLEGNSVEDLMGPDEVPELEKPLPVEDGEDLYYLCGKEQPEVIQAEAEQVWEQCYESQVYKTCLSIRRHVYTNTMPELKDKKKQALLEETEAQRDRNDWILDPKHVYRRSILRKKMPQWAESTERMCEWYEPIWNPRALRKEWTPPISDKDMWAFPKTEFSDGSEIAKEFMEFMKDPKAI